MSRLTQGRYLRWAVGRRVFAVNRRCGRSALILFSLINSTSGGTQVLINQELIDDRSSGALRASGGSEWRLVTDQVMGGRSTGALQPDRRRGQDCLRLSGSVSTANNGGFVQMSLELAAGEHFDASAYNGLLLQVFGNGESYNLHLRTSDLWLPWQSYRASFVAEPKWHEVRMPFAELEPYRTDRRFRPTRMTRIGLVAIGRKFEASLCLGSMRFYRDDNLGK